MRDRLSEYVAELFNNMYSGKREVVSVKLSPDVVDPDDVEMLEDLIVAATNEALRKMEEEENSDKHDDDDDSPKA